MHPALAGNSRWLLYFNNGGCPFEQIRPEQIAVLARRYRPDHLRIIGTVDKHTRPFGQPKSVEHDADAQRPRNFELILGYLYAVAG